MVGDLRDLFNLSKRRKKKSEDDAGFGNDDQLTAHDFSGTHSEWDVFDTNYDSGEEGGTKLIKKKAPNYQGDQTTRKKRKTDEDDQVVSLEYEIVVPILRKKDVNSEKNLLFFDKRNGSKPQSPRSINNSPYIPGGRRNELINYFQDDYLSNSPSSPESGCEDLSDQHESKYSCFFCFFYKYSNQINEGPIKVLLDYINETIFRKKLNILSQEVYEFYMKHIYPKASRFNSSIPKMTKTSFLEHVYEEEQYRDPTINYLTGIDIFTTLRNEAANSSICYKTYRNGVREKVINNKNMDDARKNQLMITKLINENPKTTQLGQRTPYSFSKSGVLDHGSRISLVYAEYWNQYNEQSG